MNASRSPTAFVDRRMYADGRHYGYVSVVMDVHLHKKKKHTCGASRNGDRR
jgi:hypothetical protein